ncbi:MAG: c-type cytochrome [Stenotrophobium sp.]
MNASRIAAIIVALAALFSLTLLIMFVVGLIDTDKNLHALNAVSQRDTVMKPGAVETTEQWQFKAPSLADLPTDGFGESVRFGEKVFTNTHQYAPQYVGNHLSCSNCHLDAGRKANSAPMWAAFGLYPAYRQKNGHVNTFAERLQGCFRFSMNGKVPPAGDPVLVGLEAYAYWLAKGAPIGERVAGQGFPKLAKPVQAPDYHRGQQVYATHCVACHGSNGAGQIVNGKVVFPALWGADSFNWGAGMHQIHAAAGFIKANMPLGQGGSLSDQQAWDVAQFVDSHERPQDPRYKGAVAATRKAYHESADSMYGLTVEGHVLGSGTAN